MDEVIEKKRGRPKKITEEVKPQTTEQIDSEKKELESRLKILEDELRKQKEEEEMNRPLRDDEYIQIPLMDKNPYPTEEERKLTESIERKVTNVRLPEKKEDTRFWGKVFRKNKVKKEGMVAVMLLHPVGDATIHYIQTESDGMFKIGDEDYHTNEHCVYNLKVKKDHIPLCILPTWTMIPIGTKAWFELSQERRGHELERMILNAIKKEERIKLDDGKKKGKLSAKTMWIVIAVIVGGYIFLKSTGKI